MREIDHPTLEFPKQQHGVQHRKVFDFFVVVLAAFIEVLLVLDTEFTAAHMISHDIRAHGVETQPRVVQTNLKH